MILAFPLRQGQSPPTRGGLPFLLLLNCPRLRALMPAANEPGTEQLSIGSETE